MKGTDRGILLGVAVIALAIAFYLLILAPKRSEAGDLKNQIDSLQASVDQKNQVADFAEQARRDFPKFYGRLVVLGKAVPNEADTASMVVQLSSIARRSGTEFRGITLSQGASSSSSTSSATSTTTPAPSTTATGTSGTAATSTTGTTATTPSTDTSAASASATTPTTTTAVPATETAAANLPIGATVGPAGLPALPYSLTFKGGFFDVADFVGGVNNLVQTREATNGVAANGRLFTVDGFALEGGTPGSSPKLDATFLVTTYVVPPTEGLTAGATPSGPAGTAPTTTTSASGSAVIGG
jgi:Tfp pilus assembly protein PilO